VPPHELSETIDDDIRTEVDWSAQDGRSSSAIDDEGDAVVVRYLGDALDDSRTSKLGLPSVSPKNAFVLSFTCSL